MKRRQSLLIGLLTVGVPFLANPALASPGVKLKDLRVVSHHWTSCIGERDFARNQTRTLSVADPTRSRFLVLKLQATRAGDGTGENQHALVQGINNNDFILVYRRSNGSETSKTVSAILTSGKKEPGDFSSIALGSYAASSTSPGVDPGAVSFASVTINWQEYFGLAFEVEAEVQTVELRTEGGPSVRYPIGKARPYSVTLRTNRDTEAITRVRQVLKARGFEVINAERTLVEEHRGIEILYAKKAQTEAEQIALYLKEEFGITASLRGFPGSWEDIVIKLGK